MQEMSPPRQEQDLISHQQNPPSQLTVLTDAELKLLEPRKSAGGRTRQHKMQCAHFHLPGLVAPKRAGVLLSRSHYWAASACIAIAEPMKVCLLPPRNVKPSRMAVSHDTSVFLSNRTLSARCRCIDAWWQYHGSINISQPIHSQSRVLAQPPVLLSLLVVSFPVPVVVLRGPPVDINRNHLGAELLSCRYGLCFKSVPRRSSYDDGSSIILTGHMCSNYIPYLDQKITDCLPGGTHPQHERETAISVYSVLRPHPNGLLVRRMRGSA